MSVVKTVQKVHQVSKLRLRAPMAKAGKFKSTLPRFYLKVINRKHS